MEYVGGGFLLPQVLHQAHEEGRDEGHHPNDDSDLEDEALDAAEANGLIVDFEEGDTILGGGGFREPARSGNGKVNFDDEEPDMDGWSDFEDDENDENGNLEDENDNVDDEDDSADPGMDDNEDALTDAAISDEDEGGDVCGRQQR